MALFGMRPKQSAERRLTAVAEEGAIEVQRPQKRARDR
jgi:hypothetical protein